MSQVFAAKKKKILSQLAAPTEDYVDASPKGSIDAPIRSLVGTINSIDSLVTTSSCSGRIAIYAEGTKKSSDVKLDVSGGTSSNVDTKNSSTQGKGGGAWLFVSHESVDVSSNLGSTSPSSSTSTLLHSILDSLQNEIQDTQTSPPRMIVDPLATFPPDARILHFKFEPLILHAAGFRESGISGVPEPTSPALASAGRQSSPAEHQDMALDGQMDEKEVPRQFPKRQRKPQKQVSDGPVMVAIRTMGLAMDAPIGHAATTGEIMLGVSDLYLSSLLTMANDRFVGNEERKGRLRDGIHKAFFSGSSVAESGNV
ncbi:hypothetical protein B9Z65_7321 [Elsinoe australis]|uniref:tRNA(Phe) 7-[(3-amino-3-carboxypropyl)-4-demethylwyosine(37)-N(4)]-methyltransferase n=1 Tax=Elsinoe australis TaxID=40998 RepID=A0A2P7YBT8_9PEZI|nr:hypothetical protein B9Z65_7321 [Elsinoe australis]